MASLILKNYLYDDEISVIMDYVYNEIPSREPFKNDWYFIEPRKEIPTVLITRSLQFETFNYNAFLYLKKSHYYLKNIWIDEYYTLEELFNSHIFKKLMNYLKRYKSFEDIVHLEMNEYFKDLKEITDKFVTVVKRRQQYYKDKKCLAITNNNTRCKFKRKYDMFCGTHEKVENVFSFLDLCNY